MGKEEARLMTRIVSQRKTLRRVINDCGDLYLVPLDRRLRRRTAKQFIRYFVKGEQHGRQIQKERRTRPTGNVAGGSTQE